MKLVELFESKIDFISRQSGAKLLDRAKDDGFKGDSAEELVAKIQTADPTGGKHLQYLVNMYLKKQFRLEDLNRIKDELTKFEKVKSKLENKDLNSYKTLGDLYDALEQFEDPDAVKSGKQQARELKSGVKKLIDTPEFKAIIPTTEEAAKFYGAGTKWCTAADKDCMFNHYNNQGDLVVLIAKDPKTGKDRKYQFHYETEQFMDERDQEVERGDIDFLSQFEGYKQFLNMMIKKHYSKFLED